MAKQEEGKEKKKTKKRQKIDYENLQLEDIELPPNFPELEFPGIKGLARPLITRGEWGAEPPRTVTPIEFPAKKVLFTYTDTEECKTKEHCMEILRRLQVQHMDVRGLSDIQYNFLAGYDFNVYEGRGWTSKPDKNDKFPELAKESYIEIAYIGNFKDIAPSLGLQEHTWGLLEEAIYHDKVHYEAEMIEDFHEQDHNDLQEYLNSTLPDSEFPPLGEVFN